MLGPMRARESILRATVELIENDGFSAVSISAVATAAGVTRQTVYTHFRTRQRLVSDAVTSVVLEELQADVERLAVRSATPVDLAVEMIVAARGAVRRRPVLAAVLENRPDSPLFDTQAVDDARVVVAQVLGRATPRDTDGEASQPDLSSFVEIVTRLGISILCFPSALVAHDDDLRRFLRQWLT
jgi:AcrR family transcriptional regulator